MEQETKSCLQADANQTTESSNLGCDLPSSTRSTESKGNIVEKSAEELTDATEIMELEERATEFRNKAFMLESRCNTPEECSRGHVLKVAVPQSMTSDHKSTETKRNDNSLSQQQSIKEIHCGEDSILLLCEDSIYEPTREMLNTVLERVYEAYMNASISETLQTPPENDSPIQAEITLARILVLFRETAMIDNQLSHIDVVKEFYRLSLERRASQREAPETDQLNVCNSSKRGSICFSEVLKLIQRCSAIRYSWIGHDYNACVKMFCTLHLSKLEHRPPDGMRWILQEALNPQLIQVWKLGN